MCVMFLKDDEYHSVINEDDNDKLFANLHLKLKIKESVYISYNININY